MPVPSGICDFARGMQRFTPIPPSHPPIPSPVAPFRPRRHVAEPSTHWCTVFLQTNAGNPVIIVGGFRHLQLLHKFDGFLRKPGALCVAELHICCHLRGDLMCEMRSDTHMPTLTPHTNHACADLWVQTHRSMHSLPAQFRPNLLERTYADMSVQGGSNPHGHGEGLWGRGGFKTRKVLDSGATSVISTPTSRRCWLRDASACSRV
jgi:hypothetical protein